MEWGPAAAPQRAASAQAGSEHPRAGHGTVLRDGVEWSGALRASFVVVSVEHNWLAVHMDIAVGVPKTYCRLEG